MNLKNTRIRTQLVSGFALMLVMIIGLASLFYYQYGMLHQQTETMYNHPLHVRRAIGALETDILKARTAFLELMIRQADSQSPAAGPGGATTSAGHANILRDAALERIALADSDAQTQFAILEARYLGPKADIEAARQSYAVWEAHLEEQVRLSLHEDTDTLLATLGPAGRFTELDAQLASRLQTVNTFAIAKGDALFARSVEIRNEVGLQTLGLVAIILALFVLLTVTLLRGIQRPLRDLTTAAQKFGNGDLSARSTSTERNEFGEMSATFNQMATAIEASIRMDERVSDISRIMLRSNEPHAFFRDTLSALGSYTGAQMAAVYLLDDDRKTYRHYESIGLGEDARQSFDAAHPDGAFSAALHTGKLQFITDIPENARFSFGTASGRFMPREIITIPVIDADEVVAIISLASIGTFKPHARQLLDSIAETLNARIDGLLANRRIQAYSTAIELQNRELDQQKNELLAQQSEMMQQNRELEMQKNQLAEAGRLKNSFLSNMSHELRTPLNSIIALSGILGRKLVRQIPDEEHSYLEIIERNGKNLLSLINSILDLSRIEAGHEEISVAPFEPGLLAGDVVQTLRPLAVQKGIGLEFEPGVPGLSMLSDADKLRHIIENLVGNAIKFTESGKVAVSIRQAADRVQVSVKDTGIGIPAEQIGHIFDEFRQADGSTSRRFGGSGLGLTIARKYAQMLGGDITATSESGTGSEFICSLPLTAPDGETAFSAHQAEEARTEQMAGSSWPMPASVPPASRPAASPVAETPAQAKDATGSGKKTILLVEDSEPAIIQMKDLLGSAGYQALVARNATEALAIIEGIVPDAMVLDLMMPEIDGFELLAILRNAEPTAHTPVLILTAKHITREELSILKRNNIHQLIQKGDVNRTALLGAIQSMLQPHAAHAPHKPGQHDAAQNAPVQAEATRSGQAQPEDARTGPRSGPSGGEKPKVLIVEDNIDNRITVRAILGDRFAVIEAGSGAEGVQLAEQHRPDLVLMDIRLPDIDGREAFRRIRALPMLARVPVIALTASAMRDEQDAILSCGFDAFVAKPVSPEGLDQTIRGVLHGR